MIRRTLLLTSFALLALAPAASATDKPKGHGHGGGHGFRVVAEGLDNPRGIDIDPATGAIYVAEAGRGGAGPCVEAGEEGTYCFGDSGAITRIFHGHQRRVVRGLPSVAPEDGADAAGPQDVDVKWGFGAFVTGLGADPAARAQLGPEGAGLASLFTFGPFGRVSKRADLGEYEAAADPDQDDAAAAGADSNPTGVLQRRHGRGWVAVDAGGNDLLRVRRNGDVSTIAVFPSQPADPPPFPDFLGTQAVPTQVVKGPDGAYYVSQLTGFPFPPGGASIFRVEPGSDPEVYASGLTNVTDLAFGRDGSLYVVEIFKAGLLIDPSVGDVVKIAPDGSQTIVADGLPTPYGLAIGRHGDLYVTTNSASAGEGQVLRLRGARWRR